MIEQYTATNKYNFPQPTTDTTLPQRFLEQSLNTLKCVQRQHLNLNPQTIQYSPITQTYPSNLKLNPEPIILKPSYQETIIVAIDTSTIKIGETQTGTIVAVRGATVWKQNGTYHYTRLGPFVFHITEENKTQLYNNLERAYFTTTCGTVHQAFPNLLQMPTRLASLLERWLQTMIAKTVHNGLLLFDGSLAAGTPEMPIQRLREILGYARRNHSMVLAFSKATTLRANGLLITEQLPSRNPPYLLEIVGHYPKPPMTLLGDIYVARLSKSNLAFRMDVDKESALEVRIDALGRLLGNDLYDQSYPETLRLSHILCTFTANEILAIKHFLTRKHGIQIVNRPDMHKLLFGAFGFSGEVYA